MAGPVREAAAAAGTSMRGRSLTDTNRTTREQVAVAAGSLRASGGAVGIHWRTQAGREAAGIRIESVCLPSMLAAEKP